MIQSVLIFLLLANAPALPEPVPPSDVWSFSNITISSGLPVYDPLPAGTYTLVIYDSHTGHVLVGVHPDGSLLYGKDYSPDKSATAFWEAIGKQGVCNLAQRTEH